MNTMLIELPEARSAPFTIDDLEPIPYDGRRYQLVRGALLVTPVPTMRHQRALGTLLRLLDDACPDHLETLLGLIDVVIADDTVLVPDLVVVPAASDEARVVEVPLLVVEVTSPITELFDVNVKQRIYAEHGVPSCWIVDPDRPSLTVYELRGGPAYDEVARAEGDQQIAVELPFPVTIVPSALV